MESLENLGEFIVDLYEKDKINSEDYYKVGKLKL